MVWLLGTSGVGKSTVGWELLKVLESSGVRAAYIDADQLRLTSGIDTSESELIAAGLASVTQGYRASDAQLLIVAGLLDDDDHLRRILPDTPRENVLSVHLHATNQTIRQRVTDRGWLVELADESIEYAAKLDPNFADMSSDTTDMTPDEVACSLLESALVLTSRRPAFAVQQAAEPPPAQATQVVVITGPTGIGVSTIGFETFTHLANAGEKVGYLDSNQLGIVGATPRDDDLAYLRALNSGAVANEFSQHGVRTVVVGADPHAAAAMNLAWTTDAVTGIWLDASEYEIANRLEARARGKGPPIAGDDRRGLTRLALSEAINTSIAQARDRRRLAPPDSEVITTNDRSPAQIAEQICRTTT